MSDNVYIDVKNASWQSICKIYHSVYKSIIMANQSTESQAIKVLEASQSEYWNPANQKP